MLLSKAELKYLQNPQSVNTTYGYVLKNRIKAKTQALQEELALLGNSGILQNTVRSQTEKYDYNSNKINVKQVDFGEKAPRMGFEPMRTGRSTGSQGRDPIIWRKIKPDFTLYLDSKELNNDYKAGLLRYLDKYFTRISAPIDIIRTFAKIQHGKRHLWLGFRGVFNYLEAVGYDYSALTVYRKALPTFKCGIDLKVPLEPEIVKSLIKMQEGKPVFIALYNLLIDSGLRLIEAVNAMKKIQSAEKVNDFYRIPLGDFRGCKSAFYAYLTQKTYDQICAVSCDSLIPRHATDYYRRRIKVVNPKYIRKFFFNQTLELGIPESVCDFYEGRLPRTVGAAHYLNILRQADRCYGLYVQYISQLRYRI